MLLQPLQCSLLLRSEIGTVCPSHQAVLPGCVRLCVCTALPLRADLRLGRGRELLWLSQLLSVSRAVAIANMILSEPLKFGGGRAFLPPACSCTCLFI